MTIRVLFLLLVCFTHAAFAADSKSIPFVPIAESPKILGGVEAAPGAWPWIAAILWSDEQDTYYAQYCSGVLIDKTWVLTAAHCVQGMSSQDIEVAVGAYDLTAFTGSRTPVKSIKIHPQYNSTFYNDIALIELSNPSYTPTIPLFSGQSKDDTPPSLLGSVVTVLGWGLADTATTWYYPTKLRQVNLPVVADSYCNDIYTDQVIPSQFCAGYYEGKDACDGDSGGPAVLQVDGKWVHAGIVSTGVSCESYNGCYGKYTRTSEYIQFIKLYVPNVTTTRNPVVRISPSINLLLLSPESVNP